MKNIAIIDFEVSVASYKSPKFEEIPLTTGIMACKDYVFVSVANSYLKQIKDTEYLNQVLADYSKEIGKQITIFATETKSEVIRQIFIRLYQRNPDLVALWHMDFDIPLILRTIGQENNDPKQILCHPDTEYCHRRVYYNNGTRYENGMMRQSSPIHPAERIPEFRLDPIGNLKFVDAMCLYFRRHGRDKKRSYILTDVLKDHDIQLKYRDTLFPDENGIVWTHKMQEQKPAEYLIYKISQSVNLLKLDEETKDLSEGYFEELINLDKDFLTTLNNSHRTLF